MGTTEAMQHLNWMIDFDEEISEKVVLSFSQKQLSILVDKTLYRTLLDQTVQAQDKARLLSVGLPHSGDWPNVIPSPSLCLQVSQLNLERQSYIGLACPSLNPKAPV